MDQQTQTFIGHNGTLTVGPNSVKISRNFKQAMATGHLLQRNVEVPFSALESVQHQHASVRPGYLQFVTKSGTAGATPMNRHHRIHFGMMHDHTFRQAKALIDERIQNLSAQPMSSEQPQQPAAPKLPYQR